MADDDITQMFIDAATYVGCTFNASVFLRRVDHPTVIAFTTAASFLRLGSRPDAVIEDLEREQLGRDSLWRARHEMIELGVLEEATTDEPADRHGS